MHLLHKIPNTPKKILEILAKDKNWSVRAFVAQNLNAPKEILEILAKDEKMYVRNFAKKNLFAKNSKEIK